MQGTLLRKEVTGTDCELLFSCTESAERVAERRRRIAAELERKVCTAGITRASFRTEWQS